MSEVVAAGAVAVIIYCYFVGIVRKVKSCLYFGEKIVSSCGRGCFKVSKSARRAIERAIENVGQRESAGPL